MLNSRVPRCAGGQVESVLQSRRSDDPGVRFADEVAGVLREPVISPGGGVRLVHALLHYGPGTVAGEEERVMVNLVAVLDQAVVHLGRHPRVVDEIAHRAVGQAERIAPGGDLIRGLAGSLAFATADEQAQVFLFVANRLLQRGGQDRRQAGGVPVEGQDCTKRLEPHRVGDAADELIRPELSHEDPRHLPAQLDHPLEQPRRTPAGIQRERGDSSLHVPP